MYSIQSMFQGFYRVDFSTIKNALLRTTVDISLHCFECIGQT